MKFRYPLLALALGALLAPQATRAADHIDAPAAVADPSADITDLYAWMSSDASKVNLIMDVTPFAGADSAFSDAVQYVFHVNSSAGYGMPQGETTIICEFDAASQIECWAGDQYVKGDASAATGLASANGKMTVFAGLRDDPFFMEFNGFTRTVSTVVGAAGGLTFDAEGCPDLGATTAGVLVGQLQHGVDDATDASNTFAGSNVLSLTIQIDKDVLTGNGPLLGVWASTNQAN
jgi:hypothetical protein